MQMKRLMAVAFALAALSGTLSADVRSQVWAAVNSLSETYRKAHAELLFQKPLAVFTPVAGSPKLRDAAVGQSLAAMLKERLSHSTIFTLVERENLDQLLGELELGLSGAVNPDTAPKVGMLVGAELFLTGTVTELGDQIQLALQLVDASTAKVEAVETVTFASQDILASAASYLRSTFQSPNGIFFTPEASYLLLNQEYNIQGSPGSSMTTTSVPGKPAAAIFQLQAGYRFLPFLSAGLGGTFYSTGQFFYDPMNITFSDGSSSLRYMVYSAGGVNAFTEAYISPSPRLNLGLRAEGILYGFANLTQDILNMPVVVPDWTVPANPTVKRDVRRVLVTGYNQDQVVWGAWLQASAEYLISARLAVTLRAGYYYQPVFWPTAYKTDSSNRSSTQGPDNNGTFPEYLNFDFARQGGTTSTPAADFDPSALSIDLGLSLQL